MSANNNNKLSNNDLLTKITQADSAITASAGAYGTSATQDADLTAAKTALAAAITAAENARTASKAATQAQDTAREAALAILGSIGGTVYYNPDVTDQMLADAGFAIHDDVPTKHAPVQPVGLTANPDEFGTVLFEWDGNGNVYPTTYVIEGRASESDPWSIVTTTTKKRLSVPGFTPGASYMFRVKASRNGSESIWSNVATIWTPEGVQLEIAA
jgi:hypothetical protein